MTLRHLGIGLALAVFACAGSQPAAKPAASFAGRPFAFGFTRPTGEKAAATSAAQLSAYLGTALDLRVTALVFDTPRELAEALASSRVDAAWMSPGAYVYAARLA
jgi:ABC-type phosphate/phosphonate transport system substrate-binding protein